MIYLHKYLPAVLSPVSIVMICIAISLIHQSIWCRIVPLFILLLSTNPVVSYYCINYIEKDYEPVEMKKVRSADIVVVLSGMIKKVEFPDGSVRPEFSGSIDRFEAGVKLIENNKAEKIIFTRGFMPWSSGKPEGEYLAEIAVERGINREQIIISDLSANTEQEASAVSKIVAKGETVILVTSAYHMARASALFKNKGLNVIPFPVDYQNGYGSLNANYLTPSADALVNTSLFLREMLGRSYYRLKYLI